MLRKLGSGGGYLTAVALALTLSHKALKMLEIYVEHFAPPSKPSHPFLHRVWGQMMGQNAEEVERASH